MEAIVGEELGNLCRRQSTLTGDTNEGLALVNRAAIEPPGDDFALVVVVNTGGNKELGRGSRINIGGGDAVNNRLEKRFERRVHFQRRTARVTEQRIGEDRAKFGLLIRGTQIYKEVESSVDDPISAGLGAINFIHDHNRPMTSLQRFPQHKLGLGHRAVNRINKEQNAINHIHDALDLTAEIGVAGRINNVDFAVLVNDGSGFRENGDPALAFERIRVHHSHFNGLIFAEDMALLEHSIHESRLAVVNVGDDGDIPQIVTTHKTSAPERRTWGHGACPANI